MLLTAVLAMCSVAYANMTLPSAGTNAFTWDGTSWTDASGNTVDGPTRQNNTGAFMIMNAGLTADPAPGNTSDGGGIKVAEGVNVSNMSLGTWGGSIQVGAGAYLDASSWSLKSKVLTDSEEANVWVDGELNLRGFGSFDNGSGATNHYWHIGKDGYVNLVGTTAIAKNEKDWNIEVVLERDETIDGVVNRDRTSVNMVRTYLQAAGNLSSSVTSLTVLDIDGNTLQEGTDYTVSNTENSLGIAYAAIGYERMSLTWNGQSSDKWVETGSCWVDDSNVTTSFLNGDSVTFAAKEGVSTTVTIDGDVKAEQVTISDDFTFTTSKTVRLSTNLGIAIAENKTLTKAGEGTLNIQGGDITGNVNVTGTGTLNIQGGVIDGDVNVTGGMLVVNTANALSGENVSITNGELKVSYSGDGGSAISHGTTVSVGAGGILRLDGHDSIGWSASQAPKLIELAGNEGEGSLASMVINDANGSTTWCAPVEMNGYSKISGTTINLLDGPTLTVTKTDNVIDINTIQLRGNMKVGVEENGSLEIKSLLARHGEAGTADKLIKTGGGTLILSHDNATYENGTEIQGGTIVVKAGKALGTGAVTISDGGTLDLEQVSAAYEVGNINMNDGSTLIVRNGYYGNSFDSAINVAGNVNLQSGWGGNSGVIASNINGKGSMSMSNLIWDGNPTGDAWKISGVISDKAETEKLSVINVSGVATLSGANTYSGGTTVNGGTLTAENESALGTGKVSMNGGTLKQNAALSISAMDYTGGTVNNNGQNLTVTGKLTAAADMSIEGAGATSIGSLDLSAGTTLSVAGSLTIGELVLDLSKYADMAQTYTLVTTTGEGATVGLSTAYSTQYNGYTASVSGNGTNSLTLSFAEIVAPGGDITTTVTGQGGFADGMLTLNVDADLTDATQQVLISGISGSIMADILGLSGLPEDGMVGITLAGANGTTFTATADQQIGFQGNDGVSYYFGEQVGSAWQYQVAYIPEPASATLGLAALMMLAARRRRKA